MTTPFTLTIVIEAKHQSPEGARDMIETLVKDGTAHLIEERVITSDLRVNIKRTIVDETPF